jgi:hypothetical protein
MRGEVGVGSFVSFLPLERRAMTPPSRQFSPRYLAAIVLSATLSAILFTHFSFGQSRQIQAEMAAAFAQAKQAIDVLKSADSAQARALLKSLADQATNGQCADH